MSISLGIKSDPINYRYSSDWLFALMQDLSVQYLQLGSLHEYYFADREFFLRLRDRAAARGVTIKSIFSSYRELGGWMAAEPEFEAIARRSWERLIDIAEWVGADTAGTSIGAVPRDRLDLKAAGIRRFVGHMHELMAVAKSSGLSCLVVEPMSSLAEPPTTQKEITTLMEDFRSYHNDNREVTVPLYLCPDISHGYADESGEVVEDNYTLFEHAIPYAVEFHIKNTDSRFESTFGFGPETAGRGIVDLGRLGTLIRENRGSFPVDHVVGYLEINGPKLGRDYSDRLLRKEITSSVDAIRANLF